jgi:hypothetical protein
MKMQHVVQNRPPNENEAEKLKDHDLISKHYPREFIGLTKNIRVKIM